MMVCGIRTDSAIHIHVVERLIKCDSADIVVIDVYPTWRKALQCVICRLFLVICHIRNTKILEILHFLLIAHATDDLESLPQSQLAHKRANSACSG